MTRPRAVIALLCLAMSTATTRAADDALTEISGEINESELRATVGWLADDQRQGRGLVGTGLDESADFLAERFADLGLETLPGLDGFAQPLDLPFTLGYDAVRLAAGDDDLPGPFVPFGWSTPGDFEGELVFAGYGISRDGYDDYAHLDAAGKVALVLRYEPFETDGDSRFTNRRSTSRDATFARKAAAAKAAGAVGLLVVNPPEHSRADNLASFSAAQSYDGPPALHIARETADALLERAGLPDLAYLQGAIDATGEPASQTSDLAVRGGWSARDETEVQARNIVGMVRGKNADEYVVVGAHYDHVGHGEYGSGDPGTIHNGADDNASGTTAVLELAETYAVAAREGHPPERSIVFAFFTAEEIGLVGSRAFVNDLPMPVEGVVAMLNLDMVGRVRDGQLYLGGANTAKGLRPIVEAAVQAEGLKASDQEGLDGRSDHAPFIAAGIPAVFLFSGHHSDYHKPTDDADLVNYDGLGKVARSARTILDGLTTVPREQMAFQSPVERTGVVLGVAVEPDPDRVIIGQVMDDSPAKRAGLQVGDTVTAVAGRDVPTFASFVAALAQLDPGDETTITVERDGETSELAVSFPADENQDPTTRP